jgi:DNA polymerase III delta prime subunit
MSLAEFHQLFPKACACLEQAKKNHRVGQAYLLIGDQQDSLRRFALAWAQTAACVESKPDGAACQKCRPCQLFQNNSYPELYQVAPQSKSRIITIDAIREFEHTLSLSAQPDRLKIGLIEEADCLGADAQNAFLKTLEEPSRGTMLLLTTTRARKLLPTIRSRCQTLLLLQNRQQYPIAEEHGLFQLLDKLHRNAGVKKAMQVSAELTTILAGLKNNAEKYIDENWDARWENAAEGNKALQKQLSELRQVRIDSEYMRLREELVEAMLAWFQQRLLIAAGVDRRLLSHPEMLANTKQLLAKAPAQEQAEQDLRWIEEFIRSLKANVEESLALDTLCLLICEKESSPITKKH